MRAIPLNLPVGSVATGFLFLPEPGENVTDLLRQDILQVSLPSGHVIDVSWFPEYDPDGHFEVVVFDGDWETQLHGPVQADNPFEAADLIQTLASEFNRDVVSFGGAETTTTICGEHMLAFG